MLHPNTARLLGVPLAVVAGLGLTACSSEHKTSKGDTYQAQTSQPGPHDTISSIGVMVTGAGAPHTETIVNLEPACVDYQVSRPVQSSPGKDLIVKLTSGTQSVLEYDDSPVCTDGMIKQAEVDAVAAIVFEGTK